MAVLCKSVVRKKVNNNYILCSITIKCIILLCEYLLLSLILSKHQKSKSIIFEQIYPYGNVCHKV